MENRTVTKQEKTALNMARFI
ncbi:Rop family plasmid primer RNA-binding protein, partial [Escherichia coli]|nr:Rop family plasmid primer RNA-binding protein [Escherichia coli]